jgi:hypothetical protein
MFMAGQGTKNKALGYSSERAVSELHSGLLMHHWDQKLCCSIGKVKSFFGRKFRTEAEENDMNRQGGTTAPLLTAEEARAERRKWGENLLHENVVQCESALIQALMTCHRNSPGIEEAKETHFSKVAPKLLTAFVKCRVLDDACSAAMEHKNLALEAGQQHSDSNTHSL